MVTDETGILQFVVLFVVCIVDVCFFVNKK